MSPDTDAERGSDGMPRVTFRCPQPVLDELEDVVDAPVSSYPNQSEAIRQAIREFLMVARDDDHPDRCPVCGAHPADVSWQTADGQQVCPTDECPVNTWGGGI